VVGEELTFRPGGRGDLAQTFALSERAVHDVAARHGALDSAAPPTDADIRRRWRRQRPLIEFIAAQPGGTYCICEGGDGPVGYARVVRFGDVEELTELMIDPEHQGRGIGRALLERAWPGDPSPDLGRLVVATGAPADLSLYTTFGVMPVAGHWHMRHRAEEYLERRSRETDVTEPAVHVLKADRATAEWQRLEPEAIGHERPAVHDFFGRERTCLATVDDASGQASALCWVSGDGEIGPAVGRRPADLVPVVLAALDRVAMTQEPTYLGVFASSIAWWLLRRLRGLGFRVHWPGWVMSSEPMPGLDRYLPTRPPNLL
jgi:GNAT superfamily N-acetyltransferase